MSGNDLVVAIEAFGGREMSTRRVWFQVGVIHLDEFIEASLGVGCFGIYIENLVGCRRTVRVPRPVIWGYRCVAGFENLWREWEHLFGQHDGPLMIVSFNINSCYIKKIKQKRQRLAWACSVSTDATSTKAALAGEGCSSKSPLRQ